MSQTNQSGATVTIRTYRLARDQLGDKELTWTIGDGTTVRGLLADIGETHGVDPDDFLVMRNGRNIKQLDGLETPLQDGDEVTLSIGSMPE